MTCPKLSKMTFYRIEGSYPSHTATPTYGEGTGTDRGCGAILMGEMWYFGGPPYGRQV